MSQTDEVPLLPTQTHSHQSSGPASGDDDPDFNHPGEPPLRDLFNKRRFHPFKWRTHLWLMLYFPFGLVFGSLKFVGTLFIAIPFLTIFGWFDQEWIFWQLFGFVWNFWSYVRNPDMLATPEEAPILCCNHVTDFDGIAFFPIQLTKHAVEITTSFLRPLAEAALKLGWGMIIIYRETDPARRHLTKEKLNEYFASPESKHRQLFVLAEGATTNGRVGFAFLFTSIFLLPLSDSSNTIGSVSH